MYRFVDTESPAQNNEMSIRTSFGGVELDSLDGGVFRTLTVAGRGLLGEELLTTRKVGADGAWIDESSLPIRYIEIKALISSNSNEEAREVFNAINRVLHGGIKRLSFSDEPDFYFNAIFSEFEMDAEHANRMEAYLTFVCADPWKYSDIETIRHDLIPSNFVFETAPVSIQLLLNEDTNRIKVTNPRTGKNILLKGNYASGDIIVIKFNGLPTITKNGEVILKDLDITSEFELFSIVAGDRLTVTPSATVTLKAQRRLI